MVIFHSYISLPEGILFHPILWNGHQPAMDGVAMGHRTRQGFRSYHDLTQCDYRESLDTKTGKKTKHTSYWLVVLTILKNISQCEGLSHIIPIYYGKQKMFQTTNQHIVDVHIWKYRLIGEFCVTQWSNSGERAECRVLNMCQESVKW